MNSKTNAKTTTRARKPNTAMRKKSARKVDAADTVPAPLSAPSPHTPSDPDGPHASATDPEDTDPWAGLDDPDPSDPDHPDEPLPPDHAASPTLASACSDWLAHLEAIGKTPSTVHSYAADLALARRFLGEMTPIADVSPDLVAAFGASDLVTKTRTGRPKAKPSIDKTRRVLRMMRGWAAKMGRRR